MPSTPQEIAAYLDSKLPLERDHLGLGFRSWPAQRPSAKEVADLFSADADFELLRFSTFLASPQGELFTEAVELLSPPLFRDDEGLVLEALQIAASERTRRERLISVGLVIALGILLVTGSRSGSPA